MMLFQEPTPDTSGYMIAGYAVAFLVMALYAASLYLRSRNLRRDMTTLEELDRPAPAVQEEAPETPRKRPARSESPGARKPVTKRPTKK